MNIGFFTPPLVEGPRIVFFVPLPEFLNRLPIAMDMGNGQYGLPVTITVIGTWFCMLVLFLLFRTGTRKLELIPKNGLQTALESLYVFLDGLVEQMIGSWKKKYFSFIATIFIFILTSNLLTFFFPIPWPTFGPDGTVTVSPAFRAPTMDLNTTVGLAFIFILTSNLLTFFFPIPWPTFGPDGTVTVSPAFRAPTMDLNTTVGLAIVVAVVFIGTSIKRNGVLGYAKGFLDPVPVMLPLNIVGELAKPVNMSMRLFGNMFAGSVIMGLLYKAAPWVVPAPLHLYFDLFAAVVQSFVFTMLTMVHIQGALGDSTMEEER